MIADVTLFDNALTYGLFRKIELGMAHDLHQIGMTHALKERELQQFVV
jgi:hypothetical protein